MRLAHWFGVLALPVTLFLAGCKDSPAGKPDTSHNRAGVAHPPAEGQDDQDEIRAALANLNPEDRQLAEKQRFCVVMNDSRLGSMGTPVKVMVKDQPVFVCCKGCVRKALKDPDQTLARAEELKAKTPGSPAK